MKQVKFKDLKHEEQILVKMAEEARKNAYAIFSGYKVGASLLADNGKFYAGVNVEARCCVTTHAEVNAIDTMVADGGREIVTICCASESNDEGYPCPPCSQKISSFSKDNLLVICVNAKKEIRIITIRELCPFPSMGALAKNKKARS